MLIADITSPDYSLPRLYPSATDYDFIRQYQSAPYICIAPASVWFTKQFPAAKWAALARALTTHYKILLLGAPADNILAEEIVASVNHPNIQSLCGKLNFLQSAALMQPANLPLRIMVMSL